MLVVETTLSLTTTVKTVMMKRVKRGRVKGIPLLISHQGDRLVRVELVMRLLETRL